MTDQLASSGSPGRWLNQSARRMPDRPAPIGTSVSLTDGRVAYRRQLAKRVQLIEGSMAALDYPWHDILAPETDGPLELQEDLGLC